MNELIQDIKNHYNDPNYLSEAVIQLAAQMYQLAEEIATAELEEAQAKQLIRASRDKITIAEVEDLALVDTQNRYGIIKLQYDALREVINAIKARIGVLQWEYKQT